MTMNLLMLKPFVTLMMQLRGADGTTIIKHIYIDVTCHVTMDTTRAGMASANADYHTMRVSGTAVVARGPRQSSAKLLRVDNIGLDSQLNLLFVIQEAELTFHPA